MDKDNQPALNKNIVLPAGLKKFLVAGSSSSSPYGDYVDDTAGNLMRTVNEYEYSKNNPGEQPTPDLQYRATASDACSTSRSTYKLQLRLAGAWLLEAYFRMGLGQFDDAQALINKATRAFDDADQCAQNKAHNVELGRDEFFTCRATLQFQLDQLKTSAVDIIEPKTQIE